METLIKEFLSVSYGPRYGSGDSYSYSDGSGYGSGYSSGYSSGDGDSYSDGSGYGDGNGDGNGDGIKEYDGRKVYMIDALPTIIEQVRGGYARGYILQSDLTLKPCYVAKVDNYFAHGKTLRQAYSDATAKYFANKPIEERINSFLDAHREDKKYTAQDLFRWHGILTNSCQFGREQFCKEHNINLYRDKFTIQEFIKLTENQYGCKIIKQLKDSVQL